MCVLMDGFRILIVEDDVEQHADILRALATLLPKDTDYVVFSAESVEHASDLLLDCCPDIILADSELPDSSGVDTVRSLRAICSDIPIIIYSGVEDAKTAISAVQNGAAYYVYKSHLNTLPLAILLTVEKQQLRKEFIETFKKAAKEKMKELALVLSARTNNMMLNVMNTSNKLAALEKERTERESP